MDKLRWISSATTIHALNRVHSPSIIGGRYQIIKLAFSSKSQRWYHHQQQQQQQQQNKYEDCRYNFHYHHYSRQHGKSYNNHQRRWFTSFLKRRGRPWTRDDVWALLSWLFVGQGAFILLGTTTAASLVLLLANSLQVHDWLARRLAAYLARHTGLEVSFGELIVPNWRTGSISLGSVCLRTKHRKDEERGNFTINSSSLEGGNYTLYDLTIDKADIRISMRRMLEGRGWIQSATVEGVRGTIDRFFNDQAVDSNERYKIQWGDYDLEGFYLRDALVTVRTFSSNPPTSPNIHMRTSSKDQTIVNSPIVPQLFRPYQVSVISANLPRLRKRFLLYDVLEAESLVGMLDGSLFSMHIPQTPDRQRFPSLRHLRLHALNVDFLTSHTTMATPNLSNSHDSPLSWLTRGSVDIDMFVKLPSESTDTASGTFLGKIGTLTEGLLTEILRQSGASALLEGFQERIYQTATTTPDDDSETTINNENILPFLWFDHFPINFHLSDDLQQFLSPLSLHLDRLRSRIRSRIQEDFLNVDTRAVEAPEQAARFLLHASPGHLAFSFELRFHNLRAHIPPGRSVPLLRRPLLAYINEQRPFVPLSCHFQLSKDNFDGAWTLHEAGIVDALTNATGKALEMLATDRQRRVKRMKKVSLWSLYALLRNIRHWMVESGYLLYPQMPT